ncbi:MAG: two-component sensor histidine kinase [Pseudonocardiales bacterium]|nr:MAG: two-component sensor histidine kinase [Pseudonocardiales bacterium]
MNPLRPTLRLRLTLLYGGLLVGAGVVLLLTSYYLVRQAFDNGPRFDHGSTVKVLYSDGTYDRVDARALQDQLQHQTEQALLRRGLIALGFVGLIGMAGGYLLAGRALRPLQSITSTAQRLSTETLDQRIALDGPDDELKELADTFDGMIARLEAAFDSQRRFVANASHELRTPLSVIRTEVDVSLRDPEASETDLRRMGGVVRTATERADRLVDALLQLARADAQGREGLAVREKVELPVVVDAALAAVKGETTAAGLRVDTRLEPAVVMGDPGLIERLAGNLVENAVRHNVSGGWLGVHTRSDNGLARLFVANSGSVVDPAEAPSLFEPFRRGGTARTASRGAGLGLSIVRAVVHAHGGHVQAYALQGGGLEVQVQLPTGSMP